VSGARRAWPASPTLISEPQTRWRSRRYCIHPHDPTKLRLNQIELLTDIRDLMRDVAQEVPLIPMQDEVCDMVQRIDRTIEELQ
jgi:hypothetical protein